MSAQLFDRILRYGLENRLPQASTPVMASSRAWTTTAILRMFHLRHEKPLIRGSFSRKSSDIRTSYSSNIAVDSASNQVSGKSETEVSDIRARWQE